MLTHHIWLVLLGIVLFLLGIQYLEEMLTVITRRPFKLFLKRNSENKIAAVGSGAAVAAIFQSSSLVNLTVLAFIGTGLIKIHQALALVLGANLGTTSNSWLIATVGFEFNIELLAVPLAGVAGLAMLASNRYSMIHNISKFLLGFGLMFVGLEWIKDGVVEMVKNIDVAALVHLPLIVFLAFGIFITSLIQSSAATVAIVLASVNVHAISLLQAMAIVLGSEVGTTFKLFIASAGKSGNKKRLAMGNLLFNLISVIPVFVFLPAIGQMLSGWIGKENNLIGLVTFQTLFNLFSIVLFLPVLGPIGRYLESKFITDETSTLYIQDADTSETNAATQALEKEDRHLVEVTIRYALTALDKDRSGMSYILHKQYERIKLLHGEIEDFAKQLNDRVSAENRDHVSNLMATARNSMYAAKSIKDAVMDIEQLRNSSNDAKYKFFIEESDKANSLLWEFLRLQQSTDEDRLFEGLAQLFSRINQGYSLALAKLYKNEMRSMVNKVEISTMMNFTRQLYSFLKSICFALKAILLQNEKAEYFDRLPGFIR